MREIVHVQAGQCGNQIGSKVSLCIFIKFSRKSMLKQRSLPMKIRNDLFAVQNPICYIEFTFFKVFVRKIIRFKLIMLCFLRQCFRMFSRS